MKLFGRLFGTPAPAPQPAIRFGRYTDTYRTAAQEAAFDAALQDFKKENYLAAYVSFFNYLLDEEEQNVKLREEQGELHFELYQGSKKVTGYANGRKLYAESCIARAESLRSGLLQLLLEENFELKYSRFSLTPRNEIAIIFDTYTVDGSPYKLYSALKELAAHADKFDDLLIEEFDSLQATNFHVRRSLPEAEKEIKYQYIHSEIRAVLKEIEEGSLPAGDYPVAMSYLLLQLCYKLDYLVRPEGYMMEMLERMHRMAFSKGKSAAEKNEQLCAEFKKLLERPREKFFLEMYDVSATFGITVPVDHQKVATLIERELPGMAWYKEHGHHKVALAIPGFIIGQALFHYALPQPDRDFFHLLMQVLEADFFQKLGFRPLCDNGKPDEKNIRQAIRQITERHLPQFPNLQPDIKKVQFQSLPDFAETYLRMVQRLDLARL